MHAKDQSLDTLLYEMSYLTGTCPGCPTERTAATRHAAAVRDIIDRTATKLSQSDANMFETLRDGTEFRQYFVFANVKAKTTNIECYSFVQTQL